MTVWKRSPDEGMAAQWRKAIAAYTAGVDAAEARRDIAENPHDPMRESFEWLSFRAGWMAVHPIEGSQRPWFAEPVMTGDDPFDIARESFGQLVRACLETGDRLMRYRSVEIARRRASRVYDRHAKPGRYVFAFALTPEERRILMRGGDEGHVAPGNANRTPGGVPDARFDPTTLMRSAHERYDELAESASG
jgi:hypothetical protein